jgi:hypothetical protein
MQWNPRLKKFFQNGTILWYYNGMKSKHNAILRQIFQNPVQSEILWKEIENMLSALNAEISEGRGSRVRISLNGVRAVFHRPHLRKETDKGAVVSMRRFLKEAGVKDVDV